MVGKLHELLAVEPETKATAESILNETINTFNKKADHFLAQARIYEPATDGGEERPPENKAMVTTVPEKLEYTERALVKWLDLMCSKEMTNTYARQDLVINGITVARSVPAVVLLNMENKLKHVKQMYLAIPTLEPGEDWSADLERKNVYKTPQKPSHTTSKIQKPLVLSPSTDKRPAQVQLITVDERIGTWKTTKYSGMLTPLRKAELLERVDDLIAAVKRARCKANEQYIHELKLGSTLFQFIETGVAAAIPEKE